MEKKGGKNLALPGDFLSTEEEFVAGKNAFDSDGNIYSCSAGTIEADSKTKEISVKPAKEMHAVMPGSIVVGRVDFVKENAVNVEICNVAGGERLVISQSAACLPVRNVSREYVEKLRDCFRTGDLIKARVAKVLPGNNIDLETNYPEFGVIKAFCSRCRQPLHLFGPSLKCLRCGSTERRKISRDYLLK